MLGDIHPGASGVDPRVPRRPEQGSAPPPSPGQPRMSDNTAEAPLLGGLAIVPGTMDSGPVFVWGCQPKLLTPGAAFEGHPREG